MLLKTILLLRAWRWETRAWRAMNRVEDAHRFGPGSPAIDAAEKLYKHAQICTRCAYEDLRMGEALRLDDENSPARRFRRLIEQQATEEFAAARTAAMEGELLPKTGEQGNADRHAAADTT